MLNLYTTKNEYNNEKFKRILETEESTYKITAIKKDYAWIIYRRVLTNKITGLCLYNVSDNKEETDPLLIEDMLKILYAYLALCNKTFVRKILRHKNKCEAVWLITQEELISKKERLQEVKPDIPSFVYEELVKIVAFVTTINEECEKLLEFITKYSEVINQMEDDGVEGVPSKLFLSFYNDLYEYYSTTKTIKNYIKDMKMTVRTAEDYFSVLPDRKALDKIKKIAEYVIDNNDVFYFYKAFPEIENIILQEFSETIIEPYKKLIRNKLKE